MSRFLATRLFLRAIKPTQIERCVSRAPSTMSMMVCSVQTQLARPSRFLASWGKEPVIDRKEIEFRVIKCVSQHDKVNQSQVCYFVCLSFNFPIYIFVHSFVKI